MKKIFFLLVMLCFSLPTFADGERTTEGLSEAQQLGITAGLALACNAGARLDDFELIASRLIANKAQTKAEEDKGFHEFAESKLNAYMEQRNSPQVPCGVVLDSFKHLPLFKSVVYADGGLKMYDGTYLKPLRPVKQAAKKADPKKTKKATKPKKK